MAECATTRAVLGVLGPMANEVMELKKHHHHHNTSTTTTTKLTAQCQALSHACDHLSTCLEASALAQKDDSLLAQVAEVKDQLQEVTEEIAKCSRKLQDSGSQEDEVWARLVGEAERLLEVVTGALVGWEQAGVRGVVGAVTHLTQHLHCLQHQHNTALLADDLQSVVSSCLVLVQTAGKHRQGLCSRAQREALWHLTHQLADTMHLLALTTADAITTANKTPPAAATTATPPPATSITTVATTAAHGSPETRVCLGLVCARIHQLLDDLTLQLQGRGSPLDLEEPGSFTKQVDQVFNELDSGRCGGVGERVKLLLEGVLRHCLVVAHCGGSEEGSSTVPSPQIMALADKVLRQLKVVITLERTITATNTTNTSSNSGGDSDGGGGGNEYNGDDLRVAMDSLAETVEQLEQAVNTALITLIAQTFAEPLAPLERLMKVGTQEHTEEEEEEGGGGGGEEIDGEEMKQGKRKPAGGGETDNKEDEEGKGEVGKEINEELEAAISAFDTHTDAIFQAAGFATACTSDCKRVRQVRSHLATLEWVEGVLIPALVTCTRSRTSTSTSSSSSGAHTSVHTLAAHWKGTVLNLQKLLDEILDPSAFVMVTRMEVQRLWSEVRNDLYTQDMTWLVEKVRRVEALISHLLHLPNASSSSSSSFSSSSSSSIQWLPQHFKEDLECALREVRGGLARVRAAPTTLSLHRSLLKRLQLSLTLLSRLSTTLESGSMDQDDAGGGGGGGEEEEERVKLTEEEKHHLITTNIDNIPVDIATPTITTTTHALPPRPQPHHPSPARLGEGRGRGGGTSVIVPGPASDTLPCDTTLEITRFLSRSSTVLSSTRGSRRNFSLKVREINLDIEGALQVWRGSGGGVTDPSSSPPPSQPPSSSSSPTTTTKEESGEREKPQVSGSEDTGMGEVSALISLQVTQPPSTPQRNPSAEEELSAVLESLTSLIGDLSGLPTSPHHQDRPKEGNQSRAEQTHPPTALENTPSKVWVTFENGGGETSIPKAVENGERDISSPRGIDKDTEMIWGTAEEEKTPVTSNQPQKAIRINGNEDRSPSTPENPFGSSWGEAKQKSQPLQGITLQNASFTPHFPEIIPGETKEGEEVFPTQEEMSGKEEVGGLLGGGWLEDIWKDFTAILESRTPSLGSFRDKRKDGHRESKDRRLKFGVFKEGKEEKDCNKEENVESERDEVKNVDDGGSMNAGKRKMESGNMEDEKMELEKKEKMTKQKSKSLFRKFKGDKEETEEKVKKKKTKGETLMEKIRKKKMKTEDDKENQELNSSSPSTSSSSSSSSSFKKQTDLSDTPFLHPFPSLKTTCSSFPSLSSLSSPPSSCNVTTSQRLQDIQTLQDRLQAIRKHMGEGV
ncbi:uncharacterized protein LOC127004170 isoform X2 [Eriocheir sinensis]|uniref:uncharacterized protein LOC127004170 isoform X2 n=1 Tax=Eriocheir sinensis TaxID=95602 RepID=UPI0021C9E631|nr:uncharacterized protein LOC127004170 isoform X2 [Eriocheir sinensis]